MFTVEDQSKLNLLTGLIAMVPVEPYPGTTPPPTVPATPPLTFPGVPPGTPAPIYILPVPGGSGDSGAGEGLGAEIIGVIKTIIQQTITPLINGLLASLQNTWSTVSGSIVGAVKTAITPLVTAVQNAINGAISTFTGAINTLKAQILGVVNSFRHAIEDTLSQMRTTLSTIYDSLKQVIYGLRDAIVGGIQSALSGLRDTIRNVINGVRDWLADLVEGITAWLKQAYEAVSAWIGGIYETVAGWITDALSALKQTYETTRKTVEEWIAGIWAWLKEQVAKFEKAFIDMIVRAASWLGETGLPAWGKAVDWAQSITKLDPSVIEDIKRGDFTRLGDGIGNIFTATGQAAMESPLFALSSAIAYFFNTVQLQFIPAQVAAQKQAIISLALEPVDLGSAAQAVYKGLIDEDTFYSNARLGGIAPERAQLALEGQRPLPTPGQVQQAFLRGEIDLSHHDALLRGYGFTQENIDVIKSLYLLIPPPSDLIRMAVREAFSPDIAEKFGQYEDYPAAFTDWAEKQGISRDWAERYWAAHWDLPSPSMGFEMLHRGVIDNEELKLLLRALDVMPYWRERLIQISYNPLTRVDVRRMYKFGVLTEEQVHKAYLDLGYDAEKSAWLTEFTKRYSAPEDASEMDEFKALARATYSQAYKKKLISRDEYAAFLENMRYYKDDIDLLISLDDFAIAQADKLFDLKDYRKDAQKLALHAYDRGLLGQSEATDMLTELGYDPAEAALELSLSDYNRQLKIRNILVNQLHDQYVGFIIDIAGLHEIMDVFNFAPAEIDKLAEEWDIERSFRTKRPTISDLRTFYRQGLITLADLLDELRGQGYHEKYIPLYEKTLGKATGA